MHNVGQTIYVAGPLFLRMVLAVVLAVVVYSEELSKVENSNFFNGQLALNCLLKCLLYCLLFEGVCETHVILAPGACEKEGLSSSL